MIEWYTSADTFRWNSLSSALLIKHFYIMVLYYNPCNPCTNMFPSAPTHHRLHPSVTTSSTTSFNFGPATTALSDQNCYPLYSNSGNPNSNPTHSQTVAALSTVQQLGLSSSPTSQYSSDIGGPLPAMTSDILQPTPPSLTGPHTNSWYSIPSSLPSQTGGCAARGSMVATSPFDEWPPAPNTGSPLSASSPCMSGSPVSSLPPCAFAAMSMPGSYGQSLQMGAYHGVHRSDPYSDPHLHHISHHYHSHPYQNSGIIAPMNSEATPVHPSPDSGLTASSDGAESPNGHQNGNGECLSTTPNGTIIKTENSSGGANRPQPARSPYEWMKKPSYQNQANPSKCSRYAVVYKRSKQLVSADLVLICRYSQSVSAQAFMLCYILLMLLTFGRFYRNRCPVLTALHSSR